MSITNASSASLSYKGNYKAADHPISNLEIAVQKRRCGKPASHSAKRASLLDGVNSDGPITLSYKNAVQTQYQLWQSAAKNE
jgi:hypothetical protein